MDRDTLDELDNPNLGTDWLTFWLSDWLAGLFADSLIGLIG